MSHRVVIVGGGFGGLYAARLLGKAPVQVSVVDRRNFHLFQPLLYQVATGALSPGEIASPLRYILNKQCNTEVLLAEAVDFDVEGRRVILRDGEIHYDDLIVATGATHAYFGHDEWEPLAPGLKTVENATEIRRRILLAFEEAEREPDRAKRHAWLTFVIVGGGPTGVELAGALGEIANDTLKNDFRHINPAEAQILLIEGENRLLPPFPSSDLYAVFVSLPPRPIPATSKSPATGAAPGVDRPRRDSGARGLRQDLARMAVGIARVVRNDALDTVHESRRGREATPVARRR